MEAEAMNILSKTTSNKPAFSYCHISEFLLENERAVAEMDSVDAMYQYIDMPQLLNAFYPRLKKSLQIDRIEVRLPKTSFYAGFCVSEEDSFKQSYQVNCDLLERDRKTYPKIILYRRYEFLFSELKKLEALISGFSGPFRNAVSYANACHAATHDYLTNLYNRNAFNKCLSDNSSIGAYRGLIVCDVDNFKTINDQYGHLVGDNLLRQFGTLLQTISTSENMVFRYGGDEFVIVNSRNCSDSARQVAKRIRSTVENTPFIVGDHSLKLTTTIGVSDILRGESIAAAFQRADRALVRGKKRGRNQVFLAGAAV